MFEKIRRYILQLESLHVPDKWMGLILFGISMLLRYWWLDARDLCIDEPFSVYHAQKSPLEIIRLSVNTEPNPPLYMLLLHFVMQLFGDSVWSVRSLSVIFSSLTGILVYSLAKRFSNISGGLIAWVLFTFSTIHFLYGSEARAYPLFRFEFMLLLWSWVKLQREAHRRGLWLLHTGTALLLLYTHYLGAVILGVGGALSLLFGRDRAFRLTLIKSYALAGLLWLPLVIPAWDVIVHRGENSLHQLPEFMYFKHQLVSTWNDRVGYDRFMGLFLVGLFFLFFTDYKERKPLAFLALYGLVCYGLLFFGSKWVWFFSDNYLLFTTLPVMVVFGIMAGKGFRVFPVITTLLLAWVMVPVLSHFKPVPKNITYREVQQSVREVQKLRQAQEPVFLFPAWTELRYLYYANRRIFQMAYSDIERALVINEHYKIELSEEIVPRLKGKRSFILYLDEYTGTNPIGTLPAGFRVRDSVLIPEVYLILYCEADSNLFMASTEATILN